VRGAEGLVSPLESTRQGTGHLPATRLRDSAGAPSSAGSGSF